MKIPDPSLVCCWSGAGISHDKPSSLPLGIQLTESVIKEFCLDGTWSTILYYLNHAKLVDASGYTKAHPRLEAVLGSIVSVLGYKSLNYLSILDAPPNHFHKFFAWHLANRGSHVTVNLDNCIGKALSTHNYSIEIYDRMLNKMPPGLVNSLIHLHGRFNPDALEELGVTVDSIAYGLTEDLRNSLIKLFEESELLIFIGYSGSDYFDINPFFFELQRKENIFNKLTVVWVYHMDCEKGYIERYYEKSSFRNLILDCFLQCEANVFVWRGRSKQFIDTLVESWSVPTLQDGDKIQSITQRSYCKEIFKPIVTANLYLSMGLGIEVLKLQRQLEELACVLANRIDIEAPFDLNKIYYILNEAFREVGYYHTANRTINKYNKSTALNKLIYFQRAAGDYWLMGSVFRSWFLFMRSLRIGQRLIAEYDADTKEKEILERAFLETNIRFLHLYRDAYRIPFLRLLLPRNPALKAVKNILIFSRILKSLPYDRLYIARLLRDMPFLRPEGELPSWLIDLSTYAELSFVETDNILGSINTSRRGIQSKLSNGKEVTCKEVNELCQRSVLINDLAGLLKASLILRQQCKPDQVLSKNIWRSWIKIEWTTIRKIYWVISYCLKAAKCSFSVNK